MTTLYMLPLEPLEERYTGQWYRWLPEAFDPLFDQVVMIDGTPLTENIKVGAFLDLNSTAHYKATQLQQVARLFQEGRVRTGDAFWVSDIEFWGIEVIRYLARLQGIHVKLFGFLHAASYTREDFMEPMEDVGCYLEPAWIAAFDRVYVGSEYHKRRVFEKRLGPLRAYDLTSHIVVTGNPWRSTEATRLAQPRPYHKRDIDLCFPHRPDREKRPGIFLRAAMEVQERLGRKLKIAFTTGRSEYRSTNDPAFIAEVHALAEAGDVSIYSGLSRRAFYEVLGRSQVVVSTAIEENYGYAMVEAMTMGALVLMPNDYSYPELVRGNRTFLYEKDDLVARMEDLLVRSEAAKENLALTLSEYLTHLNLAELRIVQNMLEALR